MKLASRWRGRLRRSTVGTSAGRDLRNGDVGPGDYSVEVGKVAEVLESEEERPWHTLTRLISFVERHSRRVHLRLSKKPDHKSEWVTEPPLPSILRSTNNAVGRNEDVVDQGEDFGAVQAGGNDDNAITSTGSSRTTDIKRPGVGCNSEIAGGVCDAQIDVPEEGELPAVRSVQEPVSFSDCTVASTLGVIVENNAPEPCRADSLDSGASSSIYYSSREANESASGSGHNPPPARNSGAEWTRSVATVDMGDGKTRAAKVQYDTACDGNWISRLFMENYEIRSRPLRPDQIVPFVTVGEPFSPKEYAEVTLRDDEYGIGWTTVSCLIQGNMDGRGLVLGNDFMKLHKVVLRPLSGHGAYVTTARPPNDGKTPRSIRTGSSLTRLLAAKREKQKLDEQAFREQQEAEKYLSSSAGYHTLATADSRTQQPEKSSRTNSSAYGQPEDPKEFEESGDN